MPLCCSLADCTVILIHTHYRSETNRHSTRGTALSGKRISPGRKCQVEEVAEKKHGHNHTHNTINKIEECSIIVPHQPCTLLWLCVCVRV